MKIGAFPGSATGTQYPLSGSHKIIIFSSRPARRMGWRMSARQRGGDFLPDRTPLSDQGEIFGEGTERWPWCGAMGSMCSICAWSFGMPVLPGLFVQRWQSQKVCDHPSALVLSACQHLHGSRLHHAQPKWLGQEGERWGQGTGAGGWPGWDVGASSDPCGERGHIQDH